MPAWQGAAVIIEHVVFRAAPGVTEQAILAADERVQREWAPHQAGFVRRTTARGAGGRWLVETLWSDDEHRAAAVVRGEGPVAELLRMVDADSVRTETWETLD